jgi:hypothetical protein
MEHAMGINYPPNSKFKDLYDRLFLRIPPSVQSAILYFNMRQTIENNVELPGVSRAQPAPMRPTLASRAKI